MQKWLCQKMSKYNRKLRRFAKAVKVAIFRYFGGLIGQKCEKWLNLRVNLKILKKLTNLSRMMQ
mgnify:CR=1 FL=1